MPYEGYVSKWSKHMPTDSYFYLSRHLAKFIMSTLNMSNSRGLVTTQNMITQKISNSRFCSMYKIESKSAHVNKRKSKRIDGYACFTDEIE